MSARDIIQGVINKVVIGTVATVVSLLALHGYNTNLKAFESAQPSAKSMSDIAVKNKEELLASIGKLISIAQGVIYKVPEYSSKDQDPSIRLQIANIFTSRHMLGSGLSKTADCFDKLEAEFETKIHANYSAPEKALKMDSGSFEAFLKQIAGYQDRCIELFNQELGVLLSRQYTETYDLFYKRAPWYERPDCLLVGALVAMLAALGCSLLLGSANSAPDDI
jgi:hypothetical protein